MPRKSRIDAPVALHHIIVRGIERRRIFEADADREIVRARSLLCYWAVRELGVTMTSLSRLLNISVQAIGKSVIRGEKLSKAKKYWEHYQFVNQVYIPNARKVVTNFGTLFCSFRTVLDIFYTQRHPKEHDSQIKSAALTNW